MFEAVLLTDSGTLQCDDLCLTIQMSHDYGWRDSCAAGGVTAMVVGSGALLGVWFVEVGHGLMCVPSSHSTIGRVASRGLSSLLGEDFAAMTYL